MQVFQADHLPRHRTRRPAGRPVGRQERSLRDRPVSKRRRLSRGSGALRPRLRGAHDASCNRTPPREAKGTRTYTRSRVASTVRSHIRSYMSRGNLRRKSTEYRATAFSSLQRESDLGLGEPPHRRRHRKILPQPPALAWQKEYRRSRRRRSMRGEAATTPRISLRLRGSEGKRGHNRHWVGLSTLRGL